MESLERLHDHENGFFVVIKIHKVENNIEFLERLP